jgi:hypothetical protein
LVIKKVNRIGLAGAAEGQKRPSAGSLRNIFTDRRAVTRHCEREREQGIKTAFAPQSSVNQKLVWATLPGSLPRGGAQAAKKVQRWVLAGERAVT